MFGQASDGHLGISRATMTKSDEIIDKMRFFWYF